MIIFIEDKALSAVIVATSIKNNLKVNILIDNYSLLVDKRPLGNNIF
jgi:hypothetical protein